MTGLDSTLAALLASRTDLVLSAIRAADGVNGAAGAAAGRTTTQADTSHSVDAPVTPASVAANAAASAKTELSEVARTLDVISRLGGAAPAVLGDTPLWPTPPRPASAFAALTTGLFDTAFSSNAAAVAAARAASLNLPPLPASVLAGELAKTVGESGLFYESHLAQWLAGQRSAASLGNEPQAHVDSRSAPLDFADDFHSAPDIPDTPPPMPARPVAMPQTPQQAAALAASVRDAPPSVLSNSQTASPAPSMAAQPGSHESAVQASVTAGIHPATLDVVRQQLDVLANGQFRWQGEAWPGTRLEWEVSREPRDARTPESPADDRAWRTRVTLSLPALGTVDAELVLTGEQLAVRIRTSDRGASRLASEGAAFARQLDAAGIALASFSVRATDGSADIDLGEHEASTKPVRSPLEHLFRSDGASA
ncbi:flagellar hook-length control protein FliK [Caballeronia grimmiae]|uniref:Flagellar hook-length control protein FliK n=1 Tax=Caballeronia grimmiae TaxID=1071679 RepID=A0A069P5Y8_9BURK|nr:flagellar hook-length control protein FliK [Caballeronia grimmiae]KDR35897.1 hypothetical protein BG57_25235 [Caballeronia grimmiae]GGD87265.1 flagellar hook-length control protein FliK [Caballeronia grimmiae]